MNVQRGRRLRREGLMAPRGAVECGRRGWRWADARRHRGRRSHRGWGPHGGGGRMGAGAASGVGAESRWGARPAALPPGQGDATVSNRWVSRRFFPKRRAAGFTALRERLLWRPQVLAPVPGAIMAASAGRFQEECRSAGKGWNVSRRRGAIGVAVAAPASPRLGECRFARACALGEAVQVAS